MVKLVDIEKPLGKLEFIIALIAYFLDLDALAGDIGRPDVHDIADLKPAPVGLALVLLRDFEDGRLVFLVAVPGVGCLKLLDGEDVVDEKVLHLESTDFAL